jgi:uncharacterized DUF497 family protein
MHNYVVKFEWDKNKNLINVKKHGLSFEKAKEAFFDEDRVIRENASHSQLEKRYFCFGKVGDKIATVRFTVRNGNIRIIGAGFLRAGRKIYETKNF